MFGIIKCDYCKCLLFKSDAYAHSFKREKVINFIGRGFTLKEYFIYRCRKCIDYTPATSFAPTTEPPK